MLLIAYHLVHPFLDYTLTHNVIYYKPFGRTCNELQWGAILRFKALIVVLIRERAGTPPWLKLFHIEGNRYSSFKNTCCAGELWYIRINLIQRRTAISLHRYETKDEVVRTQGGLHSHGPCTSPIQSEVHAPAQGGKAFFAARKSPQLAQWRCQTTRWAARQLHKITKHVRIILLWVKWRSEVVGRKRTTSRIPPPPNPQSLNTYEQGANCNMPPTIICKMRCGDARQWYFHRRDKDFG